MAKVLPAPPVPRGGLTVNERILVELGIMRALIERLAEALEGVAAGQPNRTGYAVCVVCGRARQIPRGLDACRDCIAEASGLESTAPRRGEEVRG